MAPVRLLDLRCALLVCIGTFLYDSCRYRHSLLHMDQGS